MFTLKKAIGLLAMLLIFQTNVPANQPQASLNEQQLPTVNIAAYMGVKSDVLSPQLAAQIPEDITVGQGILVTGFGDDSPAQAAGMQKNDILISYDRKPLTHPKVFIELIRQDKPGREVLFKLIRKGEVQKLTVKLGEQQYPLTEEQLEYRHNMLTRGYDGLEIKQFDDDDFSAAIRYLAPDGKVKSKKFTGTYDKVRYQVSTAPDISMPGKTALLEGVTERKRKNDGWFGKWIPFNDGNFSPDAFKNFGL